MFLLGIADSMAMYSFAIVFRKEIQRNSSESIDVPSMSQSTAPYTAHLQSSVEGFLLCIACTRAVRPKRTLVPHDMMRLKSGRTAIL